MSTLPFPVNKVEDKHRKEQAAAAIEKDTVNVVTPENEDLYEWEGPPADELFKRIVRVCVAQLPYDLTVNPELSKDERREAADRQVYEFRFGGEHGNNWKVALNWTKQRHGDIPAGYASVDYKDVHCGVVGPWLTIRECWKCGLRGWRKGFERKVGNCLPGHPCPRCRQNDWTANIVTPEMLMEDAAIFLANTAKVEGREKDKIYNRYRPKNGVDFIKG